MSLKKNFQLLRPIEIFIYMNVFTKSPSIMQNRKFNYQLFCGLLWLLIAVLVELHRGSINNYLIFLKMYFGIRYTRKNLYDFYPNEYADLNHYGPLFSLMICPFAILPDWMGIIYGRF